MEAYRQIDRIPWTQHPNTKEVVIKPLISQIDHGLDVTCMLVRVPVGIEVGEHIHSNQDDILYPLTGKGTMWVEGIGEFELFSGIVVRVPKGTKHKILNVTEELLIYDVFCPALM